MALNNLPSDIAPFFEFNERRFTTVVGDQVVFNENQNRILFHAMVFTGEQIFFNNHAMSDEFQGFTVNAEGLPEPLYLFKDWGAWLGSAMHIFDVAGSANVVAIEVIYKPRNE